VGIISHVPKRLPNSIIKPDCRYKIH